jgi:hypothetical protein
VELQLQNQLPALIQQPLSDLPTHDIIITECMTCLTDLSLQVMHPQSVFAFNAANVTTTVKESMSEIHEERMKKISAAQDREVK